MEPEQKSHGALIGSIIIIIILIIGGVYLLQTSMKNKQVPADTEYTTDSESTSLDSTTSVEMEADSIDVDSVDSNI